MVIDSFPVDDIVTTSRIDAMKMSAKAIGITTIVTIAAVGGHIFGDRAAAMLMPSALAAGGVLTGPNTEAPDRRTAMSTTRGQRCWPGTRFASSHAVPVCRTSAEPRHLPAFCLSWAMATSSFLILVQGRCAISPR